MKRSFLIVLFVFSVLTSCNSDVSDEPSISQTDRREYLKLIEKYDLQPITQAEYNSLKNSKEIHPIDSPDKLELILTQMNTIKELSLDMRGDNSLFSVPRIKTKSESGSVAVISGSNSDGTATVYVDLVTPSVITSTYQLGLMDAFVSYTHLAGSASRDGNTINFTAYGQGVVKLIWEGIELYKFNSSIAGHCNSNGSGGVLTKF